MSSEKKRQFAAALSVIVSVVVLIWKLKAYYATNSLAVLSDALETVANVVTAFVALFAVRLAAEPADENHPYGHGKAEHFSAAFEGGLIFFAGLTILFTAIQSFYADHKLENIETGLYYSLIATGINLFTGFYLLRVGKNEKSEALKASGKHLLADVITTFGVMFGLIVIYFTGQVWIDSALSILLGLWLLFEAYKILRLNSGALMDEVDDKLLNQISEAIQKNKVTGVIDIHHLRMIRSGNFHHIDAHMVVPEFWTIDKAHDLSNSFEKAVVKSYEFDGEFAFHMDPCQQKYCTFCAVDPCPVRRNKFLGEQKLTSSHLKAGPFCTEIPSDL